MNKPDALNYTPHPAYLRALLERAGLSQRGAARLLGIGERTMRYYLSDEKDDYRQASYVVQYCLESLSNTRCDMTIDFIISEIENLANSLEDTPIFYFNKKTSEGIIAMQQAAGKYNSAKNNAEKLDAALWINEAYLIFSSGLPDTGIGEKSTGWASASEISKLMRGPEVWEARIRAAFEKQDNQ